MGVRAKANKKFNFRPPRALRFWLRVCSNFHSVQFCFKCRILGNESAAAEMVRTGVPELLLSSASDDTGGAGLGRSSGELAGEARALHGEHGGGHR